MAASLLLLPLLLLLASLVLEQRRQQRLRTRLASFVSLPEKVSRPYRRAPSLDAGPLLASLDTLLGIQRNTAPDSSASRLPCALAGSFAALLTAAGATRLLALPLSLALPAAALLGIAAARLTARERRGRVLLVMEDQFALALGILIRAVRAGLPVTEAIRAVGEELPAPTGAEFRRCTETVQFGEDLQAALNRLADRCLIADYRFFAVAVALQRQTGGNLAETLENLAETIRRRKAVRLRARALSAETRATVLVLSLIPFAVGALLMLVNPDYIGQLFSTTGGRSIIVAALVSQGIGLTIIRALVRRTLR